MFASNLYIPVQFSHWNCNFYTSQTSLICSAKIALLGCFSAASRSIVFFYTGAAKRRSAKQNGCSGSSRLTFSFLPFFLVHLLLSLPPHVSMVPLFFHVFFNMFLFFATCSGCFLCFPVFCTLYSIVFLFFLSLCSLFSRAGPSVVWVPNLPRKHQEEKSLLLSRNTHC